MCLFPWHWLLMETTHPAGSIGCSKLLPKTWPSSFHQTWKNHVFAVSKFFLLTQSTFFSTNIDDWCSKGFSNTSLGRSSTHPSDLKPLIVQKAHPVGGKVSDQSHPKKISTKLYHSYSPVVHCFEGLWNFMLIFSSLPSTVIFETALKSVSFQEIKLVMNDRLV